MTFTGVCIDRSAGTFPAESAWPMVWSQLVESGCVTLSTAMPVASVKAG